MPVEDPKAIAQTYLAKHNIEKIFEVSSRTLARRLLPIATSQFG